MASIPSSAEAYFEQLAQKADFRAKTEGYYQTLVESDRLLKITIDYLRTRIRPPGSVTRGSIEFGIIPYWCVNPPEKLPDSVKHFLEFLVKYKLVPPPTVTQDDYNNVLVPNIKEGTAVASDGTLFGFEQYEQLDHDWIYAPMNDLATHLDYGKAEFGPARSPVPLKGATPGQITIAIVGDWGTGFTDDKHPTGQLPAKKVIDAIAALETDYIIHLGDVYYSGRPSGDIFYFPWFDDEEREKFVDIWPKDRLPGGKRANSSFTLNSNHEMYCGGHGLFKEALDAKSGSPFAHQNGTSYFLLENDDWQIFGLDSAYDSPYELCMKGALNSAQKNFMAKYADPAKKVIILTHHTGLDTTGTECYELWGDVETGLGPGREPDYWYWGHIHNAIVYNGINREPVARNKTNARCVGHGAIPYGLAWGLTKPDTDYNAGPTIDYIDTVEFFAHEPSGEANRKGQVKNGFAVITLEGANLTEVFYDEDGKQVWPRH